MIALILIYDADLKHVASQASQIAFAGFRPCPIRLGSAALQSLRGPNNSAVRYALRIKRDRNIRRHSNQLLTVEKLVALTVPIHKKA